MHLRNGIEKEEVSNVRFLQKSLWKDLVQSTGYGNVAVLLSNTPIAETELKGVRRVWVNSSGSFQFCDQVLSWTLFINNKRSKRATVLVFK